MDFKKEEHREEYLNFKDRTLQQLDNLLTNELSHKKSALLTYWLKDYTSLIKREKNFNPKYLPVYKLGQIVEINLGYNLGAEFGGLHYAVVVSRNDNKSNPNLIVIPMTSKSSKGTYYQNLDIGTEFFEKFQNKIGSLLAKTKEKLADIDNEIMILYKSDEELNLMTTSELLKNKEKLDKLKEKQKTASNLVSILGKHMEKLSKMKSGSVILTNQITTISKMRVTNPVKINDTLNEIILPSETIDKLKEKLDKTIF